MIGIETAKTTIEPRILDQALLVLDDNQYFLDVCRRMLTQAGFERVMFARDAGSAVLSFQASPPDVFLVDIHLGHKDSHDGLEFLKIRRDEGYRGIAVVVSGDSSIEQLRRAATSGADDFLLKGMHFDLPQEIARIIRRLQPGSPVATADPDGAGLGYFRSYGLEEQEMDLIAAFSDGFPDQNVLALRTGCSSATIETAFTRIFDRLNIGNTAQLAHLLTVCSFFDKR